MISLCLADLAGGPEQISGKCNLLPLTPIRLGFTSVNLLSLSGVSVSTPVSVSRSSPPMTTVESWEGGLCRDDVE